MASTARWARVSRRAALTVGSLRPPGPVVPLNPARIIPSMSCHRCATCASAGSTIAATTAAIMTTHHQACGHFATAATPPATTAVTTVRVICRLGSHDRIPAPAIWPPRPGWRHLSTSICFTPMLRYRDRDSLDGRVLAIGHPTVRLVGADSWEVGAASGPAEPLAQRRHYGARDAPVLRSDWS